VDQIHSGGEVYQSNRKKSLNRLDRFVSTVQTVEFSTALYPTLLTARAFHPPRQDPCLGGRSKKSISCIGSRLPRPKGSESRELASGARIEIEKRSSSSLPRRAWQSRLRSFAPGVLGSPLGKGIFSYLLCSLIKNRV